MAPQNVDKTIHPHATGAAARLAAQHQSEHELKLYAGWFCPFVQRTWIVLNEKRIDYQYIEINPYHKDPEFLKLNPRGLVPTLAVPVPDESSSTAAATTTDKPTTNGTNGTISNSTKPLYESIVISEYLDEHYSDPGQHGPRLLPTGNSARSCYDRARCRLWIDHISHRIIPAFYRMLQHTPSKDHSLADTRADLHKHLTTLFREILAYESQQAQPQESGPWFLGSTFSLVDITLAPWALRLFLIDHYKMPGGVGIPAEGEGGEDEEVWARWRTWFAALQERPSIMETMSERDKYIEVYKRYADDETGSEVGQATRSGRGLP